MTGCYPTLHRCRRCGYAETTAPTALELPLLRPWHIRGPNSVRDYIISLGLEAREWLLAMFIDDQRDLLSVQTLGLGDETGVDVNIPHIICRGLALHATAMIVVHNHPSGIARASGADRAITRRLRYLADRMGLQLLDHLIVAGDKIVSVDDGLR